MSSNTQKSLTVKVIHALIFKGRRPINIVQNNSQGIVGRFGARKTFLTNAFFRIVEASAGNLPYDSVDIGELGLQKVRSSIGLIPQVLK